VGVAQLVAEATQLLGHPRDLGQLALVERHVDEQLDGARPASTRRSIGDGRRVGLRERELATMGSSSSARQQRTVEGLIAKGVVAIE
jgi:hypothetical protein